MSDILKGLKAFFIPLKLSDYDLANYRRLIEKHCGSISHEQTDANVIFTALKSASRISRNVKNNKISVVDVAWIKDCDKSNTFLGFDKYVIVEGTEEFKLSQPEVFVERLRSVEILNRRFSDAPPEKLAYEEDDVDISFELNSDNETITNKDNDLAPEFINAKYECLRPTPYKPKYNKKLISLLELLEKKRQLDSEDKRSLSYRHAISAIKAYPREIKSAEEAEKINGVGKKMADKIKIFLETGTIDEANLLRYDEEFRTLRLFNQAFGVGVVTAKIWWNLGYRTLQEVLDKAKLSSAVRLGIELLPDLDQSMSREDAEEVIGIIKREAEQTDSNVFLTPVGGYRRGKTKNGDVDIIISTRDKSMSGVLDKLMDRLESNGYLKHKLWHSGEVKHKKPVINSSRPPGLKQVFDNFEKCYCVFIQPSKGIMRQVDLIAVPPSELPMAILGWTGSRQFERSFRDFAKREKNMHVNSQSIHIEENGVKRRIPVHSEEEAFQIVGVPYLPPELRNC